MVKALLEKLNPDNWPLPVDQLPVGTALVGGAVRDGLLNRLKAQPDLDLVVPNNAIKISQNFAQILGATVVVLDSERDMARLVFKGWTIDFARQIGCSLEEDLWRRDFRINAIGLTLGPSPEILDPTGGIEDLKQKMLVAVNERNLIEDPLRCLRGFRLMAELDLSFDPQTRTFINTHASQLPRVAPERIQSELQRIVCVKAADKVLDLLKDVGILNCWCNKEDTLKRINPYSYNQNIFNFKELSLALPLVRLTHLLSDSGLVKLRFSRKQCYRCKSLRKWQKHYDGRGFETLKEEDRFQLHKDLEDYLPALIFQLSSKDQEVWINRWRDLGDPLFHPSSPVDGNTLREILDLPEGPKLGALIHHLSHERAFGRLSNIDQTIQEARNWWNHNSTFL